MHSMTDFETGSQMDFQSINRQWLIDEILNYLTFENLKKLLTH